MKLNAVLLLSLLATTALATPPRSEDDPRPSPAERPEPPKRVIEGERTPPAAQLLARDQALSDRFTEEGQTVRYQFAARRGELSLFELDTFGFERGWSSAASVRILDSAGKLITGRVREGQSVYHVFVPFEAPADGLYLLELGATRQYYRYVLVRHSQFAPHGDAPVPIGDRELVYGWIGTPRDKMSYSLDLTAGAEVDPTVRCVSQKGRAAHPAQRLRAAEEHDLGYLRGEPRELPQSRPSTSPAARGTDPADHPDFVVSIEFPQTGTANTPLNPYTSFVAPTTGRYLVRVADREGAGNEGGLFELRIDRAPERVQAHGFVDDGAGDPVAGVTLQFFREPDLDHAGTVVTDDEGAWALRAPAGSYMVFLGMPGGSITEVRTTLLEDREMNFLYGPPPPGERSDERPGRRPEEPAKAPRGGR